jgi:hypothetical protein
VTAWWQRSHAWVSNKAVAIATVQAHKHHAAAHLSHSQAYETADPKLVTMPCDPSCRFLNITC